MSTHIVLDLETLGLRPGAVVASIGAVCICNRGLAETIHLQIDVNDAQRLGFHVEPDTVSWWSKQSEEARRELQGAMPMRAALETFHDWLLKVGPVDGVWGNGPTLDNALLCEAYQRLGYDRPWSYKVDRCYRTIKALNPNVPFIKPRIEHVAVEDAVAEAIHLLRCVDL